MEQNYGIDIANNLKIKQWQADNTIKLIQEGSTIPFIARYRKEATGQLDETVIQDIMESWGKLVELDKRRASIIKEIEGQGKLTPVLKESIENAATLAELEDLYLPYRPKKKTRATIAKERGLENLAKIIFGQEQIDLQTEACKFLNKEVKGIEDALQGARDIISEWVSEDKEARQLIRHLFSSVAVISSRPVKGKEEEGINYRDYFEFSQELKKCPSHRILAIRRGEKEGYLRVSIDIPEDDAMRGLEKQFIKGKQKPFNTPSTGFSSSIKNKPQDKSPESPEESLGENPSYSTSAAEQVKTAISDSYRRLIKPSIENEFLKSSKEEADEEAIKVFAENLKQLLLAPVLGKKRVLAIDPGYRTGCKVACMNEQGDLICHDTIYPHPPSGKPEEAAGKITGMVEKHRIEAIAVGNGTASRETIIFIEGIGLDKKIQVYSVNESGASIYSASDVAREEFPGLDITVRGTISIGRRLLDPLSELVKITPRSLGVGQYQHDVDQRKLQDSLDRVVESCVNLVGVNLNTASRHLLNYVSGLGPALALNIANYRAENGPFGSRADLLSIPRMGEKAFEQCAGFLRIPDAGNKLENTAVHPESYFIVGQMASDMGCSIDEIIQSKETRSKIKLEKYISDKAGMPTLIDIIEELEKPGRDPRKTISIFEFMKGIYSIEDLQIGMILPGIITNITNFGAFVDIGIKQDGLIHISELSDRYVSNPADVVRLSQEVRVKVLNIDIQRKRIQLSIKQTAD